MRALAEMLRGEKGLAKDVGPAVIWSAKADRPGVFWDALEAGTRAFQKETKEDSGCAFNQVCYSLGWGLFWYQYGSEDWSKQGDEDQVFGCRCLDFYCSCVELQQKSILTFLLSWNRIGGMKDVGVLIGKMAWEVREDNLVMEFE
jgi:hypothetical protein